MVIKTVMELHNLAILVLKTFQRILRNLTNNKNITTNIFRIQTFNSKICDIFVFIDFTFKAKSLTDFTE